MSKWLVDTSALLACLFDEPGADKVLPFLEQGQCVIASANYAELVGKLQDKGLPPSEILRVIDSLNLEGASIN